MDLAGNSATGLDVTGLEEAVFELMQQGVAESTRKCYKSSMKRYTAFCSQFSLPCLPASDRTLSLFIAFLGRDKISSKTIRIYLSGIRHFHVLKGLVFCGITPKIELLLRGVARENGSAAPNTRLPITPDILRLLKRQLAKNPQDFENRMLWAAIDIGFFAFLRSSEFLLPDGVNYDPSKHLAYGDIKINRSMGSVQVILQLKHLRLTRQSMGHVFI